MFLGKKKSSLPQRMLAGGRKALCRTHNAFHPRVETLEGRALPSVNHLSLNLPVVTVVETSFNVPFTIRIDFITVASSSAVSSPAVAPRDSGGVAARLAPAAVSTPNVVSVDASVANTPARGGGAPAVTATSVEPVSLISFTAATAPVARPVVIRPAAPETPTLLFGGFTNFADQPLLMNSTPLPRIPSLSVPDPRTTQPLVLPVQAITNRMEFIGGGTTLADNPVRDANPPELPAPLPPPVEPPPAEMGEDAFGGMLGSPLEQAMLANDSWVPDAMILGTLAGQDASQETLTPGLAAEVAALAVCLGNFRPGSPPEVAAQRGRRNGVIEILSKKWKQ